MKMFLIWFTFIFVTSCTILREKFENNVNLNGKLCPVRDQLFTATIIKKIACVGLCSQTTNCNAVVYTSGVDLCTGCNGSYDMSSDMLDRHGSLFYTAVTNNIGIYLEVLNKNVLYSLHVRQHI